MLPRMDLKFRATGICAIYTVLRQRMCARLLDLADLGYFTQLRSQAGDIDPMQLVRYSKCSPGQGYVGHPQYLDCITEGGCFMMSPNVRGVAPTRPSMISTLLLKLEADLVRLVRTVENADFRCMAMRLLTYILADSGNVKYVSWIVRFKYLIPLLDVPRNAALSVALLDAFCHVCTQWNVLVYADEEDYIPHFLVGIKGLHESSPLYRLILEVEQRQAIDFFCVYSIGLMRCLCVLRDGLDRRFALPTTDFDALEQLRERFRVLLDRCRCTDCVGLIQMTMAV
jgi:hypothetical protein